MPSADLNVPNRKDPMTDKTQAATDAGIAIKYANEMFAERRKHGLVVGGCYDTQAYAAIEVATRITQTAGLPDPKLAAERNARTCHHGGAQ